ncbi:MAG: DUF389 domain-containing protein [Actinomycetota bacterium]
MSDQLTNDDLDGDGERPGAGEHAGDGEFLDAAAAETPTSLDLRRLDLAALGHPVVVRSLFGVGLAVAIMVWPDRTDQVLARLVGLGALAFGLIGLWSTLRRPPRIWGDLALAALATALGVGLLVASADRSSTMLGRVLGLVAVLAAGRQVLLALRRNEAGTARSWPLTQAVLLASTGLLLLAFPTDLLTLVIFVFAVAWALLGAIAIAVSLDPATEGIASYRDAGSLVVAWLEERPKEAADRRALYAKILYDGAGAGRRIIRFFSLMSFAAVIAGTGVVADSTAVVIGAMLIAPLMTPLMGMAISLVMGWPVRLAHSATIAGAGILLAIAIGVAIGLLVPAAFDPATNAQVVSRTSPTTLDLLIAVAAGAAGAYGLSRPDVSDSLPGVAIAISLVPPLSVVGLTLSQGAFAQASGAILLFATNMVAILVMGGVVFVITGVTPIQRLADNQQRVRTALAAIGALGALVIGGLLLNGAQIAQDVAETDDVEDVASTWLEPFPRHRLVQVDLDGDQVVAVVLGPTGGAPGAQELADALADRLDRTVAVDVRLVVEERDTATGRPGG